MKKIFLVIAIAMSVLAVNADEKKVVVNGNVISYVKEQKKEDVKTKYEFEDGKGNKFPIYLSKTGRAYIIKVSKKTGNEYKQYLGEEVSRKLCAEYNVTYKEGK